MQTATVLCCSRYTLMVHTPDGVRTVKGHNDPGLPLSERLPNELPAGFEGVLVSMSERDEIEELKLELPYKIFVPRSQHHHGSKGICEIVYATADCVSE